jgi:hypothetical protein
MDLNKTLEKIEELKKERGTEGIFLGKKIVKGKVTDENSIIFIVDKKKPIEEIDPNEMIPSSIQLNEGDDINTDVIETIRTKTNICPPNFNDDCVFDSVENKEKHRPLKGGISIRKTTNGIGTLGFLAIHSETGALVGVSNLHVIAKYHFLTGNMCAEPPCDLSYNTTIEQVYQPGESSADEIPINNIGRVMYCKLLPDIGPFNVDCGLIAIKPDVISNSESFKQLNLTFTNIPEFATTEEINSLVVDNIELAASGRSTGHKEGSTCGLRAIGLNVLSNTFPYFKNENNGTAWEIPFTSQIEYCRVNSDCPDPSIPGDSGSVMLGNFNGTWKIVGLNYAGGTSEEGIEIGLFNRIDKVAEQMGIEPWDGSTPNFIDLENYETFFVEGTDSDLTKNIGGETFWQVGFE